MRIALLTFLTVLGIMRVTSSVTCKGCANSTKRSAIFTGLRQQISRMSRFFLTVFMLDLIFRLLFRPTNSQYINSNVYFLNYCDMFRCIDIIFRESFLIYAKVRKSVKLIKLKYLHKLLLQIINSL